MTTLRRFPRWQIVAKLKQAGITQYAVGRRAGCSTSTVNNVIARRLSDSPTAERVWVVLEDLLQ